MFFKKQNLALHGLITTTGETNFAVAKKDIKQKQLQLMYNCFNTFFMHTNIFFNSIKSQKYMYLVSFLYAQIFKQKI